MKADRRKRTDAFDIVRTVGQTLPDVEATTRYDGSPVLKVAGCFMAGLATHGSAEPNTLVVRADFEDRQWLIEDAPDTYYLTDYYRRYPLILVRLSRVDRAALRDLLSVSWRLTVAKARPSRRSLQRPGTATPPASTTDGARARIRKATRPAFSVHDRER
jgi:hypothetical protein